MLKSAFDGRLIALKRLFPYLIHYGNLPGNSIQIALHALSSRLHLATCRHQNGSCY